MKIMKKITILVFILLSLGIFVINNVYAEEETSIDTIFSEIETFKNKGRTEATAKGFETEMVTSKIKPIAQILTTVGVGVILCITVIMGIKWLLAKPDEQAKLKQQLIGLLVAAIVIFGAYTIWKLAVNIASNL